MVLKDSPPKSDSDSETESDNESSEPREARRAAAPVARSATTASVTAPFFQPPAGRASRTGSAGGRITPSSQPGSRVVSRAPSTAVRMTSSGAGGDDSGLLFDMEGVSSGSGGASAARSLVGSSSNATELEDLADEHVEITPLDFIPGGRVVNYRDRLALTLVKETYSISEAGGMGAFCHAALIEAQVRYEDYSGEIQLVSLTWCKPVSWHAVDAGHRPRTRAGAVGQRAPELPAGQVCGERERPEEPFVLRPAAQRVCCGRPTDHGAVVDGCLQALPKRTCGWRRPAMSSRSLTSTCTECRGPSKRKRRLWHRTLCTELFVYILRKM